MSVQPGLDTFIIESLERLESMESALLTLDLSEPDQDAIHSLFRDAHTIKGAAGLFGLDAVVQFTHTLENLLDLAREGMVALSDALRSLLLRCTDQLRAMIDDLTADQPEAPQTTAQLNHALMAELQSYLSHSQTPPPPPLSAPPTPARDTRHWHISARFAANVLHKGLDPLAFIKHLRSVGQLLHVAVVPDALPPLGQMDPRSCYLGFEIALASSATKAEIARVFRLVEDACDLRILPPDSQVAEYLTLIEQLPEETLQLGEILVRCGSLSQQELATALNHQRAKPKVPLGEILVDMGTVQPKVVEKALASQQQVREQTTLRIEPNKLDTLINQIGELITVAASTQTVAQRNPSPELHELTTTLSNLVADLRDSALQLRMVKIGSTFARFRRLVHDVAQELGKSIRLEIHGEDTELDKTLVESIRDPLVHLVRNAMDHGIEAEETRYDLGKPGTGTIKLDAYHDSGSIVITVSDDGSGFKRDKILSKALQKGLVEPGQTLSEKELFDLIFEPGFSTAQQVSSLSGRGVGMDVVKRNITALRGTVMLQSQEGEGTTVTIRLPLTLAIIEGFQVRVGDSVFVVPLDMIEECLELRSLTDRNYLDLRGQVLPFIRLHKLFDIQAERRTRQSVVVVRHAEHHIGLAVDALLGESQTVVKPLDRMFNRAKCVSGASILGTGDLALILDIPGLIQHAEQTANLA